MQINDFDYDFPEELIALRPTKERSDSRLMCLNQHSRAITHHAFKDIVDLLTQDDLLIFNDTKVIQARLYGEKSTGGKIELLITQILDRLHATALIRSNKAIKIHSKIFFAQNIMAEIIEKNAELVTLKFSNVDSIDNMLEKIGHIPLPPYIDRLDDEDDETRYQTVYAKHQGAIAAPTAGLHFDQALLTRLKQRGIEMAYITLHVGIGTFQPVRVENITTHQMHEEQIEITADTVAKIAAAKARGGRVIAVGTTSVRSLETAAAGAKTLMPFYGKTSIFIYPGFKFQVVDALITNLHLPRSTLLMLVCAFAGRETVLKAYQQAVLYRYRFFSYGDAMFITNSSLPPVGKA